MKKAASRGLFHATGGLTAADGATKLAHDLSAPIFQPAMIRFVALAALIAASVPHALAQTRDPNLGRNLAANCANCHGTEGHAVGGMPILAGRARGELVHMLKDFRNGKRSSTVMQQLARGYSDEQLEAVSDFLSRQAPGAAR